MDTQPSEETKHLIERTLILVKPDGVQRGLIGRIISKFEDRGFRLVDLKMFRFTRKQSSEFYSLHASKSFFNDLVKFITSGPVVAAVLEGAQAINVTRSMIGATKSYEAQPGTIRGDFGLGITDNIIHASDSQESFERESKIIF